MGLTRNRAPAKRLANVPAADSETLAQETRTRFRWLSAPAIVACQVDRNRKR